MTHRCMDCGSDNCTCKASPMQLIDKLAYSERKFLATDILAPVICDERGYATVQVRVEGVVREYTVRSYDTPPFKGIAILHHNPKRREWLGISRPAPRELADKYFKLLPRVRLVLLEEHEGVWDALPAEALNNRSGYSAGPLPVHLVTRAAMFDTVYARLDGQNLWFEKLDRRRHPSIAYELSLNLNQHKKPGDIRILGSTPVERLGYQLLWMKNEENRKKKEAESESGRIAAAVSHAGGSLVKYWKAGAGYTVQFNVDGNAHSVSVSPTLSVISSGICLSGKDKDFDLASLVSVFREKAGNR